jgi:advillin
MPNHDTAIFKHQGYDVTEIPEDKPQQLISCNGSLKVMFPTLC